MAPTFKEMTNFMIAVGAADVSHTKGTYLAHAIGVYNDMKAWGEDDALCGAALFHSIYGTEGFQDFTLPLERRGELEALIGTRAERLAYYNCAMDRASLDAHLDHMQESYLIRDRLTGQEVELPLAEYDDLCRVHLCDLLEQVARSDAWNYRRAAYQKMAQRLGGVALESYDHVFGQEPR